MNKKFLSVLDELNNHIPESHKEKVIETRVVHAISSLSYCIKMIKESYSEEDAEDLIKKIHLSIKTDNTNKFTSKLKSLK